MRGGESVKSASVNRVSGADRVTTVINHQPIEDRHPKFTADFAPGFTWGNSIL